MPTSDLLSAKISMNFSEIEKKRQEKGMSIRRICLLSGTTPGMYYRARKNKRAPRQRTIDKWASAVRSDKAAAPKRPADFIAATYRGVLALISEICGVDAEKIVFSRPSRRANSSKEWSRAAQYRALAVHLTIVEFDLPAAEVARAAGVTRAAASKMNQKSELLRDYPEIEALLERVGALVRERK